MKLSITGGMLQLWHTHGEYNVKLMLRGAEKLLTYPLE